MRYAIYYTPPHDNPLTRLGSHWLGRDAFSGEKFTQPALEEVSRERLHALTPDPRRYGFHGTMKAPFALADGRSEDELRDAFAEFCERMPAFDLPGLAVTRLGSFLALTPAAPLETLDVFAATCVETFDAFRAPLSDADRERRLASGLSDRQAAYLQRWGYPYVFDEFRFHMTLSSRLEDEREAECLKRDATRYFASVTERPRAFASLGLFAERERGGPFTIIDFRPLKAGVSTREAQQGTVNV
ncbi:DUF1045 domain-containing protein [Rhizobiales bacterium]|uniref:DUF1045 domain-containing protein n=1 Tax=Hongsoonwoonella zoysiae TaxID=2821844 RepID=UPI0015607E4F|nr:DUF1045 domain-containing protein [Hongsoonwoonella zoysiae]NRG16947.1 DUF1045 domain-containing protein [Hongsoonwoonella zoysiae]